MFGERQLILTCEHGGNEVPAAYADLFHGRDALLATHRGYDIGALELARRLAAELDAPLAAATVTRLLVDLNRSPHNRRGLFSELTRPLPAAEQAKILIRHYYPYREAVTRQVQALLDSGRGVVHLAVHSFTPVLRGQVRNADIGLLYDPARSLEADFCRAWAERLHRLAPTLRVRRNYPYRGASDALVTGLRRRLPAAFYLGLELEVNQALALGGGPVWKDLSRLLATSLR
ncbi:N-formylglutamate amidohydrolase [Geoalkalibacter sp.]|uniref:N-formylglutamate amidohydrolase n=1 Tax=Geoalkalibacter sp. TaxID=3041440 RepID=UPI00272E2E76|nr:N-formylglutamate amidohydrolase [Geoalkalibacter sp.]